MPSRFLLAVALLVLSGCGTRHTECPSPAPTPVPPPESKTPPPIVLSVTPGDDFAQRVVNHHDEWLKFLRAYLGCKDRLTAEDCRPAQGTLDRKQFERVRLAADALFRLSKGEKLE